MPKKDKILCVEYRVAPPYALVDTLDYDNGEISNCARCKYWAGTKCQDIHKAVAANEKSYDAFDHMVRGNRGVFL